jgi:DMSO/TMAO reductase YedYZ molybdopterin-dependent catalytic subunit
MPDPTASPEFTREEVGLALRNPGMPLEALRHPVTPVGMHYLLIHFDIPQVDASGWSLTVDGLVDSPLRLSLDDLRSRPTVTMPVVMECAGNGRAQLSPRAVSAPWHEEAVGCAEWTGTPLRGVLEEAGMRQGAVEVVFTALDRGIDAGVEQDYARSLSLEDARRDEVLLAWGMNGAPLPAPHGFPLRLVVPDWYGMASVKWLRAITVLDEPFDGVQQAQLYRLRAGAEDPGEPVQRKLPRALMVPPGIPEFLTRRRHVRAGPVELQGRAWSGYGEVERVEVSADGGRFWSDAQLGRPLGPHAWQAWSLAWEAAPGDHELCVRATDAAGHTQPLEATEIWNHGGYAVNAVQRVPVRVD